METKKPPIGIVPKYVVDRLRAVELSEAITRYLQHELSVPDVEWAEELLDLIQTMKRRREANGQ